jgi:acyl-CoA synthetase (NDP forming)
MVAGGVELILGAHLDPHFGMLVLCGLGGIYAETLQDVAVGFPPLVGDDAERMLRSLRGFPLLDGARGRPRADLPAVVHALETLSRVVLEGTIESLDVNPLIVLPTGQGAVAVDSLLIVPA